MSLSISPGGIIIDDGGAKRFDTNEPLFHTTNQISGSQAFSTFAITTSNIDQTDSYLIGSCNAACTHLIGAMKFTLNSYGAGMAFDRWHSIMGGTCLWVLDGEPGIASAVGDNGIPPSQFCAYGFRISGTNVYLDRRIVAQKMPTGVTYSILSHTLNFYLEAGLFT